jgi:hypothetical protein
MGQVIKDRRSSLIQQEGKHEQAGNFCVFHGIDFFKTLDWPAGYPPANQLSIRESHTSRRLHPVAFALRNLVFAETDRRP